MRFSASSARIDLGGWWHTGSAPRPLIASMISLQRGYGVGDVAQLVARRTGTLLARVQLPGVEVCLFVFDFFFLSRNQTLSADSLTVSV